MALESDGGRELQQRFVAALSDDLDLPEVSALLQEVLRADIPGGEKRALLEDWDRVLALDLTATGCGDLNRSPGRGQRTRRPA